MSDETLPSSWCVVTIEEITEAIETVLPAKHPKKEIRYLDISGIDNKSNRVVEAKTYLGGAAPSRARQLVRESDILFSTVRTYLKNIARVPAEFDGQVASTGFAVLRPSAVILSDYLFAYTLTSRFLEPLAALQRGSSYPAVRDQDVRSQPIPLPPLTEQKRIVAKIEELFSELEAGEESLRVARRQLGVYRQSLLKQAFEGKLTEKWRTENHAKLESPESLIGAAVENRRQHWNGRGKYQPAKDPKLDAERPIPDCWTYASVDQVTLNFDGQRVPLKREDRDKRSGAYPYYGASGVIDDIDDFLFDGDYLLIAEDGANLLSRSTPIAFQAHGKFWVNNHAHIVQPVTAMLMRYLELFLNGRDLTRFITGTAQPKLTQANLDQVAVPLCSLPEQQEIVRLLDEQFEVIERNEREIDAALKRSEALRQSILKKAFTGRLVPQDPSDEPASALLARLRAEREESGRVQAPTNLSMLSKLS